MTAGLATALQVLVGASLCAAVFFFFVFHVAPGRRMGGNLRVAFQRLGEQERAENLTDLDALRERAMVSPELKHCWDEFRDTLHPQKVIGSQGEVHVARWRSTALASTFFTEQALVHSALRTEFYKHLPGILTGVGIIGTFGGLILGLQAFGSVDLSNPDATQKGLSSLLREVGSAFVMSGGAIFLAMVLTTIEKLLLNDLLTKVESLCSRIDSFFDAGAGEEYLQRLVEAAETSATQALQMKESLVTDLKQVLTELTTKQIVATQEATGRLGQSIAENLNEGLKNPLRTISEAVTAVSSNQGDAVQKLLTDVLTSFSAQMEGMFGRQLSGMGEMLSQTAATMQTASTRIEEVLGQIQKAGDGAAEAMAKRMDEALAAVGLRQEESARQMQSFLEAIRESVSKSQAEANESTHQMINELSRTSAELVRQLQASGQGAAESMALKVEETLAQIRKGQEEAATQVQALIEKMKISAEEGQRASSQASIDMIAQLGKTTGDLLKKLSDRSEEDAHKHSQRQEALSAETAALFEKQSQQIERLATITERAEHAMREAIDRIHQSTTDQITKMGVGAQRLLEASDALERNLGAMKSNSDNLVGSADELTRASLTLRGTVETIQQVLADHQSVRDGLRTMLTDLQATFANAKKDAAITGELVAGLKQATERLTQAQRASVSSLEEAATAITDAHGTFAKQVVNTLREGNRVFHEELASATGILKNAIQDLGDTLDNIPSAKKS